MGRLTKLQEKKHDEALALLSLIRRLEDEEVEFVYRHYNPMATHRIAKGAIYFTPFDLAALFAVFARIEWKTRIVDLAAGTGLLTYHMLRAEQFDSRDERKHHVCVEIEDEFVQVGKKLLPHVEWIRGNIFDRDLLESLGTFGVGIANPPFGHIPSLQPARSWMKSALPAHLATLEVMVRLCQQGGFAILPRVDTDYPSDTHRNLSMSVQRLRAAFPGVHLSVLQIPEPGEQKFVGADPNVVITELNTDECEFEQPYGFADVKTANGLAHPTQRVSVAAPLSVPAPPTAPVSVSQQLTLLAD